MVTGYTEAGVGNGWKIPDNADFEDIKTAGFIPNRPFGQKRGIPAGDGKYNNWSWLRAEFINNDIAKKQAGYGNAFYLYDKSGSIVWFPINGLDTRYNSNIGYPNGSHTYDIDHALYIMGEYLSEGFEERNTIERNIYTSYVSCGKMSLPEVYLLDINYYNKVDPFYNSLKISHIIEGKSKLSYHSYDSSSSNIEQRKCTPSKECANGVGGSFGPLPPDVSCTAWEKKHSYEYHSYNRNWTYRLTHD